MLLFSAVQPIYSIGEECDALILPMIPRHSGLDWSDQGGNEIGSLGAGSEVLVGGPVGLDRGDVAGDSLLVEKEVLGGVGNEALGVGEGGGPLLDGGEVVVHSSVHARSHVGLEVEDELLE